MYQFAKLVLIPALIGLVLSCAATGQAQQPGDVAGQASNLLTTYWRLVELDPKAAEEYFKEESFQALKNLDPGDAAAFLRQLIVQSYIGALRDSAKPVPLALGGPQANPPPANPNAPADSPLLPPEVDLWEVEGDGRRTPMDVLEPGVNVGPVQPPKQVPNTPTFLPPPPTSRPKPSPNDSDQVGRPGVFPDPSNRSQVLTIPFTPTPVTPQPHQPPSPKESLDSPAATKGPRFEFRQSTGNEFRFHFGPAVPPPGTPPPGTSGNGSNDDGIGGLNKLPNVWFGEWIDGNHSGYIDTRRGLRDLREDAQLRRMDAQFGVGAGYGLIDPPLFDHVKVVPLFPIEEPADTFGVPSFLRLAIRQGYVPYFDPDSNTWSWSNHSFVIPNMHAPTLWPSYLQFNSAGELLVPFPDDAPIDPDLDSYHYVFDRYGGVTREKWVDAPTDPTRAPNQDYVPDGEGGFATVDLSAFRLSLQGEVFGMRPGAPLPPGAFDGNSWMIPVLPSGVFDNHLLNGLSNSFGGFGAGGFGGPPGGGGDLAGPGP